MRYAIAICSVLALAGTQHINAQTNTSNALDFDGSDDYVDLPDDHYFTQNGFTIEAWVYPRAYNNWSRVIDFSNGPSDNNVLMAITEGVGGHPAGSIFKGASGTNFTANSTLELNTWSHLVITVNGSDAAIYINGELDAEFSNINVVNDVERTLNYIGKSAWADGAADMVLDELKIWDRVLTGDAIADNMYKKPAANQPGLVVYFDFDQGDRGGDNTGITSLIDKSGNNNHGTFYNFELDGTGSNFVEGVDISEEASYSFVTQINTQTTITKNIQASAFDLSATSISTAPFTYTIESGTSVSLDGATVNIKGIGTSVVRISQAAVPGFTEASIDVTINILSVPADLAASKVPYSDGVNPSGMASGDLNGDGFKDLVVTFESADKVMVYTNDGAGAFETPLEYAVGDIPAGVAIGDIDGDGKPDLVTSNFDENTVSVLVNTGTGTFNPHITSEVGSGPASVSVGDLDGDGDLDMATTNFNDHTVSVLLNTGTGTFDPHVDYEVGSSPRSIVIGDLDGDGAPDLATADQGDDVISVLINSGTGTFSASVHYDAGGDPYSVAIGDLDGDGKEDLVAVNMYDHKVSALINDGTGAFDTPVHYDVVSYPARMVIDDLDGDGHNDLAVTNSGNNIVSVLVNTGTGTFNAQAAYEVGWAPIGVAVGDWNNDMLPDLATANVEGNSVSIILNAGGGVFGTATNIATGYFYNSLAVGDLNGDGKDDLVATSQNNDLIVRMNLGNDAYAYPIRYEVGDYPKSVVLGDVDGDGNPDVVTVNNDESTVSVLINTSIGTLNEQVKYDVGANPQKIVLGDLDGDGKLDLATTNFNDNTISVLINTGTGTFNTQVTYDVGSEPRGITIGDFDGDGHLDLATANSDDNTVSVLINTGTGSFNAQVTYDVELEPHDITIVDLDGDGHPDLATANYNNYNTVSILMNDGTGSFTYEIGYYAGSYAYDIAVGDMNGDNRKDLIIVNESQNSISVLNNTAEGFESGVTYDLFENTPNNVVIADLDDDGRPDLAGVTSREIYTFSNTTELEQTITFAPLAGRAYGSAAFNLAATSSSGLPITYTSSNPAIVKVEGIVVTILDVGTVSITASQAGGGFYLPATAEQSLTVSKANQTITFAALADKTFGDATFNLTATSSSTLAVTYSSSNTAVAIVDGSTVTIVGAGTTSIIASQAGDDHYNAAASTEQSLTVNKASQTITFASLADKTFGDAAFNLTATASSSLAVTYTSDDVTISGNQVTLTKAGRATILAVQEGNTNFAAATAVEQSFCVNPAKPVITADFTNATGALLTSSAASGNQWYLDNVVIANATEKTFTASVTGLYTVKTTTDQCTSVASEGVSVLITGIVSAETVAFHAYPNPAADYLTIEFSEAGEKQLEIMATDGKVVHRSAEEAQQITVDVATFSPGLYVLKVRSPKAQHLLKFVKK